MHVVIKQVVLPNEYDVRAFGPFGTKDAAEQWVNAQPNAADYFVLKLERPQVPIFKVGKVYLDRDGKKNRVVRVVPESELRSIRAFNRWKHWEDRPIIEVEIVGEHGWPAKRNGFRDQTNGMYGYAQTSDDLLPGEVE